MPVPANEKTYIGDGVYAHHDGYHIWLTTPEGMAIALEPGLPSAVLAYESYVRESYLPDGSEARTGGEEG